MKVQRASVSIAAVLFTITLLSLVPWSWNLVHVTSEEVYKQAGFAFLAHIGVGLLVTWAGLYRELRWTWFVMFIIVWFWAFPLLVLPLFQHHVALSLKEIVVDAWREPGPARTWSQSVLIFAGMVIALALPIGSLLSQPQKPSA